MSNWTHYFWKENLLLGIYSMVYIFSPLSTRRYLHGFHCNTTKKGGTSSQTTDKLIIFLGIYHLGFLGMNGFFFKGFTFFFFKKLPQSKRKLGQSQNQLRTHTHKLKQTQNWQAFGGLHSSLETYEVDLST